MTEVLIQNNNKGDMSVGDVPPSNHNVIFAGDNRHDYFLNIIHSGSSQADTFGKMEVFAMGKFQYPTGYKINRWTIINFHNQHPKIGDEWECMCECGEIRVVRGSRLRNGESKSCGCRIGEILKAANTKHGDWVGNKATKEYQAWRSMKKRCYQPKNASYERYHGRGIVVCERWLNNYENFLSDMGRAPAGSSLDRIDNDGCYAPDNCRWATAKEQASNRSNNVKISFMGDEIIQAEFLNRFKIHQPAIRNLMNQGYTRSEAAVAALSRKINKAKQMEIFNA